MRGGVNSRTNCGRKFYKRKNFKNPHGFEIPDPAPFDFLLFDIDKQNPYI